MLKNELRKRATSLERKEEELRAERRRVERLRSSLSGKYASFLPKRDERVLSYRWAKGKSVNQTAKKFKLSPGRVSQITKDAEGKLLN